MHNPWTLKPWHIRVFFHRLSLFVPEDSIEMPEEEISGPNMDYEQKEFAVFIKVINFAIILPYELYSHSVCMFDR
jgi:hypothetical protein